MRKILFRGKTLDGFWVRGDLVRTNPCECHIVTADLDDYNNIVFNFEDFVDYKTVGQSTSLPDKNGKIIFEGDIVKRHASPMLVKWDDESASFITCYYFHDKYYENTLDGHKNLEIIGNIYDNPELLG